MNKVLTQEMVDKAVKKLKSNCRVNDCYFKMSVETFEKLKEELNKQKDD